ncbi:hypothetical protein EJ08DRAFT_137508 [Tothia fuscella]|uniref:Uncharacterized protein n=1 Tax=Tothia fuscella TaxID=1048955 RepID=A0A9P4NVQ9_9PEZI|nr:hypothetical protein EJ08DRAFT_137508 [Tothia fuscella]
MAPERWRILESRPLFCSVGLVTFALLVTSTSFTIIDATELKIDGTTTYRNSAITAATLDGFALIFVAILTASRMWYSGGWLHRWILPWSGALLALAGGIITLNMLVLKKINPVAVSKSKSETKNVHLDQLNVTAEFILWGLSIFAETIFYTLLVLRRTSRQDRGISFLSEKKDQLSRISFSEKKQPEKRHAPQRPPTPPTPLRIVAPHYALPEASALTPDYFTSPKESRRSSWRDSLHSLHHVVRPVNSRTRLLKTARESLSRDSSIYSDTRSTVTSHSQHSQQSDAFDTWDTSNVEFQLREALSPIVPTRGTQLETIPGSRPVSPAKVLEGYQTSQSAMALERPPTALTYHSRHDRPSTAQSTHSKRTFVPSRSASPSMSEAHIHPLFRTDSPTPPPATSAGTMVIASPFGGQVMSPNSRSLSRMRAESRASSRTGSRAPSPAFKPNADEQRAMTALSMRTISRAESFEEERGRSRSTSPVGRSMTPPIPEFILTASREILRSTSLKETLR